MTCKEFYEAPAIVVLELNAEGVICQSGQMNVVFEEEIL